jgi:hypothetical protein
MASLNKIAISFLAYGDEHIKELNHIIKKLTDFQSKIDFFVTTNDKSKIEYPYVNINETNVEFNYNLKRLSIESALSNNDVVLFLDSDMTTKTNGFEFEFLKDLENGLYVNWVDTIDNIRYDEQITLQGFIDGKIKTFINSDYFIRLKEMNTTKKEVFFIRESFFIIKLNNKQKKEFIKNWDSIVKHINFNELSNNKTGIMEGMIIYLTCLLSGINVFEISKIKSLNKMFHDFNHIGDHKLKDVYNKKELI